MRVNPPLASDFLDEFRASDNADEFLFHYSSELMEKYGDMVALAPQLYLMASPHAFKHILKTHETEYSKNNETYARFKYVFGESLIVTEGPRWKQHRELLQVAFNRQRLSEYAYMMVQSAEQHIQHWKQNQIQEVNIVSEIKHLTLSIAFKVFCNHSLSLEDSIMLRQSVLTGLKGLSENALLARWFPNHSNRYFFKSIGKINKLLKELIQKRRLALQSLTISPPLDLLSLLVSSSLEDTAILDELKTMILTSHETTACALAWCWHLLNQYPEYRLLMEEEIEKVIGKRTPNLEDCNALPITKAIFLETLRLYPSIWCLFRTATKDDHIQGYSIPKNSRCLLNIHALHRNPNYWENPDIFYPPRFLGEASTQRHPYAFLPFSLGSHTCIGSHFAMTEGILLLATFAQHVQLMARYDLKNVEPTPYLALQPPVLGMGPVYLSC